MVAHKIRNLNKIFCGRSLIGLLALTIFFLATSCSTKDNTDYVERSVEQIYNAAMEVKEASLFGEAIRLAKREVTQTLSSQQTNYATRAVSQARGYRLRRRAIGGRSPRPRNLPCCRSFAVRRGSHSVCGRLCVRGGRGNRGRHRCNGRQPVQA